MLALNPSHAISAVDWLHQGAPTPRSPWCRLSLHAGSQSWVLEDLEEEVEHEFEDEAVDGHADGQECEGASTNAQPALGLTITAA